MLETYLNFFYICAEPVAQDVRELRLAIWDWHDSNDRIRGLDDTAKNVEEYKEFIKSRDEQRETIQSLAAWKALPKEFKRRAFEDGQPVIKPKGKIAPTAGISAQYYRMIYAFLSTYSHGAPLAVSHSLALGEGSDEAKVTHWIFLNRQINITIWLGCFAARDVLQLFEIADVEIPRRVLELLRIWEDIVGNWPQDDPESPNL
ncbi:MAG: hypothetical protein Kow0074_02730 [Candidatus Zixiibacteriota bacterium]